VLWRRTRHRHAHRAPLRSRLAALAVICSACASPSQPLDGSTAVILEVIDGDTVVASLSGITERIRLLGIDTPEVARDGAPAECGADLATDALSVILPIGSRVSLRREIVGRDHYGRILAHVIPAGSDRPSAPTMAERGFARAMPVEPNTALSDTIERAVSSAKSARRGIWALCPTSDR